MVTDDARLQRFGVIPPQRERGMDHGRKHPERSARRYFRCTQMRNATHYGLVIDLLAPPVFVRLTHLCPVFALFDPN